MPGCGGLVRRWAGGLVRKPSGCLAHSRAQLERQASQHLGGERASHRADDVEVGGVQRPAHDRFQSGRGPGARPAPVQGHLAQRVACSGGSHQHEFLVDADLERDPSPRDQIEPIGDLALPKEHLLGPELEGTHQRCDLGLLGRVEVREETRVGDDPLSRDLHGRP